jgi:GTP-binding protein
MDLPEAQERWPELERRLHELGYEALPLSAVTRQGADRLIYRLAHAVRDLGERRRVERPDEIEVITIKPHPDHIDVERKRNTYYVHGETAERLAIMTDMDSDEAVYRLQQRLKRLGVFRALERAGIHEGNRVRIGDVEFTWDSTYKPEVKPTSTSRG